MPPVRDFEKLLLQGLERLEYLFVFGEAAHFFFREDLGAVGCDDKFAATALLELWCNSEFLLQRFGQTGRLGKVVSFHAIFDDDLHRYAPWGSAYIPNRIRILQIRDFIEKKGLISVFLGL